MRIAQRGWKKGYTYSKSSGTASDCHELQRRRVHAVPQTCGRRTVVENVAEVRVAFPAQHFHALHPEAPVRMLPDVLLRDRRPEAGPAGAGFELLTRTEQGRATTHAAVQTLLVIFPVAAGEGTLGSGVSRHGEFLRREHLPPLVFGLDRLLHLHGPLPLAGVGEDDERNFGFRSFVAAERSDPCQGERRDQKGAAGGRATQAKGCATFGYLGFRVLHVAWLLSCLTTTSFYLSSCRGSSCL